MVIENTVFFNIGFHTTGRVLRVVFLILRVVFLIQFWPRGYKTFFMLNSAEYEIFHANKSQITNNAKFFLAKRS